MRVVIRGHETCGLIADLAAGFARRGDEVVTIAMPHRFFPAHYDHDLYELVRQRGRLVLGGSRRADLAARALWRLSPDAYRRLELSLEKSILKGADLYIQVWADLPRDDAILPFLRSQGTRIASLFMGSDVRDYELFQSEYGVERWTFPKEYFRVPRAEKEDIVRRHERYADAIFSAPDQMALATRPYHHLQVPIDLARMTFRVPARDVPIVVHAPSVPHLKGTDVIEEALEGLRSEGIPFEFRSVRDMPHEAVLALLADADVLVDELVMHGPGWLSFEAMASGCAVATRYLSDSPACFRPPVVSIDERTIRDRLRELLTDRAERVHRAEAGREYVERHNTVATVIDGLLTKTMGERDAHADYVPARGVSRPTHAVDAHLAARHVP